MTDTMLDDHTQTRSKRQMETLIELYDERAIENVLGPEVFHPRRVVYLCPPEIAQDPARKAQLKSFFRHRGIDLDLEFVESSLYKADKILKQLHAIAQKYDRPVLDITGGTDAALFAAGMFCRETGAACFTYSRKKNRFYAIHDAPFANELCCVLRYSVEDFFMMAGGTLRKGRVDNSRLFHYMDTFEPFFALFLRHRREWVDHIVYLQRISQIDKDSVMSLQVKGACTQKGERGSTVTANADILRELEQIGYLHELQIDSGESVSFCFADEQIRAWLRDVGAVLELYMYKVCMDTGIFTDVVSSAIVDWDGTNDHDSVSNEIDVVASRGIMPIFISCKATEVKTEALNELAILTDRFGGKGAKAAIVTTENCHAAIRHRAAQLGIAVIDREELENGMAGERLRVIMKVKHPTVRSHAS